MVSLSGETGDDGGVTTDEGGKERRVQRSKTFDAGFVDTGRKRKGSNSSQDSGVTADATNTALDAVRWEEICEQSSLRQFLHSWLKILFFF